MKQSIVLISALLLLLGNLSLSWGQGACIITDLNGDGLIFHEQEQPIKIKKFKKMWPGDQLAIPKDANVQLAYLAIGRIEKWNGPVRLTIGTEGSSNQKNIQKPTVENINNLTAYLKNSEILNQRYEGGQIELREELSIHTDAPLDDQGRIELHNIQNVYKDILRQRPKGDIVAAIYYLAGLEKLRQKKTMAKFINKLLEADSSNSELEEILINL